MQVILDFAVQGHESSSLAYCTTCVLSSHVILYVDRKAFTQLFTHMAQHHFL